MVSKLRRRSGVSVGYFAHLLGWDANVIYQVGIGQLHDETDVLKDIWPDAKFVGFEPHPKIIANLKQAGYPGMLFDYAVSDFNGEAALYGKSNHKDGSSLFPQGKKHEREKYQEIKVKVATFDTLFPNPKMFGEPILLWLDCEGSEMRVLHGGTEFIESVDVINIEMTANPVNEGWADTVEIHNFLMENGFYRQHVHTQRSGQGQCDAIYVRPHIFDPRFCCCPCQVDRYRKEHNEV